MGQSVLKTKPATEYALLGTLISSPKHGYEIRRFLESHLGSTWRVGTSQLYALLKRLEQKGLLRSSMEPQETRPSKRVFTLTPSGREVFLQWLRSPAEHVRDLRIEFLAKIFFFHHFALQGADRLIEAQIQTLEQIREGMMNRRKEEADPYADLVSGFKLATLEAWLRWLCNDARPFALARDPGRVDSLIQKIPQKDSSRPRPP